eukprot:TRINITY_DN10006_c0_g1_i2.p1 TRINITY_DN10006_c0_g1~~TRINITY_DN10006_c0_g1_i2.p1  ORF type:complete len:313 (-),score=26.96 TRINITY_DN10006_c0_g1_i2:261-1199(-)
MPTQFFTVFIIASCILLSYQSQAQKVQRTTGFFRYYDKFSNEETFVEVVAYKREQSNGHLIMILNSPLVGAEEYEVVSRKLAERGYPLFIAKYYVNTTQFWPVSGVNGFPNIDLLYAILPALKNQRDDLPKIDFQDVVILGHSFGGFFALYDTMSADERKNISIASDLLNFLPDNRSQQWDEYVRGIFTYEGWSVPEVPVPSAQFLVVIGSPYRKELILAQEESFPQRYNASFYVIDAANHFLINNFQGSTQVVPGARVARGQDNFTTSLQEWDIAQNLFVDIVDYEIQQRLDGSQEAGTAINSIKLAQDNI